MYFFRPILTGANLRDRALSCLGMFIAIAWAGVTGSYVLGETSPLIIAPVGASAVIVFAIPASPLAQPWPVIGGNMIAAFVGLACAWLIHDPTWAAALAASLALAIMSLTRSLHPPGGAIAMTAALGGPVVAKWGLLFPLVPVAINSVAMVAAGVLFHRLLRRSYPHRPAPAPTAPTFVAADIDEALQQMGESFDIARTDLERLLEQAEVNAHKRRLRSTIT
ncbi:MULTISPECIES: HPP family protein [unclassified Beijerinckia]|uniref:HPP family protein n=1 Tax=unclassified Beijerinckia TaxID=2638183 RepID=UPI00089B4DB5|nr:MULTISPECIES: HPP family protein [unclassified Beijerinckia]MDH7793957.1 CBS domain-containing membrane protein [Beijerinckia sp. GAS462]SEB50268.1 CBS domain-containing membrane protein [Beijerinckia sp. 28-YEA-48]